MKRKIRIRREHDGAIVYDRFSRKYWFVKDDFFGEAKTHEEMLQRISSIIGMPQHEVISIDLIDNGLSHRAPLSAPIGMYLEISSYCNLHCQHCYKANPHGKQPMSTTEIKGVIDQLADMGIMEIRICGFEPVIHPDFVSIASYAKGLGLYVSANTNGFYRDAIAQRLVDAQPDEIIVSLDGNEEHHDAIRTPGSFQKVVEVLTMLKLNGIKSRINTTISRFNFQDIEYIGDLAVTLGAYVSYMPFRVIGEMSAFKQQYGLNPHLMKKMVETIETIRRKYPDTRFLTYFDILAKASDYYHPLWMSRPCPARKNSFISHSGDVYPCDFLIYLGDTFFAGNLREKSFSDIWFNSKGLACYRELGRTAKCESCELLYRKCYGGCPSETLAHKMQIDDPLCFKDLLT